MSAMHDADHSGDSGADSAHDVVAAVLRLLQGLPERPGRLRVRLAGTVVDLDWRTPVAPSASRPASKGRRGKPAADGPATALPDPGADSTAEISYVCAPSVGTFYRAPGPEGPAFVEVDEVVDAGQQVGIVEAMKLMLPVEADRVGRVVELLVEDGQPVEFGQRLLALAPVAAA